MTNMTELIKQASQRLGLKLTNDQCDAYAAALPEITDSTFDIELDEQPAPRGHGRGDDEYNAVLYEVEDRSEMGKLDDLSAVVKDNMAVAGVPMTCGSNAVSFVPPSDSTVVERLQQAGAKLIGTTNMDEFALTTTGETCAHGRTLNPNAAGRVPGGSSSGSAAAVAAGIADIGLGSDTGGSIRIPASYCGIVGLKPTHRTVPRFGFGDLAPSLDHVGPLTETVQNAFRVYDVLSGPARHDLSSLTTRPATNTSAAIGDPVDDMTVGIIQEAMTSSDSEVRRCVDKAVTALESTGMSTRRVSLPSFDDMAAAVVTVANSEFAALVANRGVARGSGTGYANSWRAAIADLEVSELGDGVVDSLVTYEALFEATDGEAYVNAQNARIQFARTVDRALDNVDALALPTTRTTALPFGEVTTTEDVMATIGNTSPFNATGHPALSVPCGYANERPVGLQFVTERFGEPTLAALGSAVDRLEL
jgi:aspartyl-tRNA(Asn)/glutamyl-tRNA(Gln) amidotransferase subunit A